DKTRQVLDEGRGSASGHLRQPRGTARGRHRPPTATGKRCVVRVPASAAEQGRQAGQVGQLVEGLGVGAAAGADGAVVPVAVDPYAASEAEVAGGDEVVLPALGDVDDLGG